MIRKIGRENALNVADGVASANPLSDPTFSAADLGS
jgi:hypothetical protein